MRNPGFRLFVKGCGNSNSPKIYSFMLKIYDILGNEIATLVNQEQPVGYYYLNFNLPALSSGIYFYQLRAGSYVQTKKMIILK